MEQRPLDDLIGRATLLINTMNEAELREMIRRQEGQIFQSMPPKRSKDALTAKRAYVQTYDNHPDRYKRICPPHLRGKEVGRSFHEVDFPEPTEFKPEFTNRMNFSGAQSRDYSSWDRSVFTDTACRLSPEAIAETCAKVWAENGAGRAPAASPSFDSCEVFPAQDRHPMVDQGCTLPPRSNQPLRDVNVWCAALDAGRSKEDALDIAAVAVRYKNVSKPNDGLNSLDYDWLVKLSRTYIDSWLGRGQSDPGKTTADCISRFGSTPHVHVFTPPAESFRASAKRIASADEFNNACQAIWSELVYQDNLPRRTPGDEAKDTAGFATLGRRYLRLLEDHWSEKPGVQQPEGNVAVPECLDDLRKLAAIFARAMIYCGIRPRLSATPYAPSGNV